MFYESRRYCCSFRSSYRSTRDLSEVIWTQVWGWAYSDMALYAETKYACVQVIHSPSVHRSRLWQDYYWTVNTFSSIGIIFREQFVAQCHCGMDLMLGLQSRNNEHMTFFTHVILLQFRHLQAASHIHFLLRDPKTYQLPVMNSRITISVHKNVVL